MRVFRDDCSEFHDQNGVPTQYAFYLRRPVITVLKLNYFGRCSARFGYRQKIGVSRNDHKPTSKSVLPDRFIGCIPFKVDIEYVSGIRKQLS